VSVIFPDARLMSVAIKVAPRRAIHFVKKQMSKRISVPTGRDDTTALPGEWASPDPSQACTQRPRPSVS
jgi:hypothetical protein